MEGLFDLFRLAGNRFQNNVQSGLANMTPEKWIRLVIIAGACTCPLALTAGVASLLRNTNSILQKDMLLRPYLIKLGARSQMQSHENAEQEAQAKAEISPNQLRGQIDIPEDSDDEGETPAEASGPDWGKNARKRQRNMIKKLLEAEEKRLQESKEEEEDKDIEEFLVKE